MRSLIYALSLLMTSLSELSIVNREDADGNELRY